MTPRQHTRHAFTLLELLIVIGIIAGLAAITTLVGTAVVNSGKKNSTLGVLQSLDQALAAYIDTKGTNPPALVEIPEARVPSTIDNNAVFFPAIDGRGAEDDSDPLNDVISVALFIESVRSVPSTQEIINSINPRYLQTYTPSEDYFPQLLTAFDAWGNPIRYVHPKFDGVIQEQDRMADDPGDTIDVTLDGIYFNAGSLPANIDHVRMNIIRRNFVTADELKSNPDIEADSDGGIATGNRPYFYSAGPDGNPATIDDNIYINPVQRADPGIDN